MKIKIFSTFLFALLIIYFGINAVNAEPFVDSNSQIVIDEIRGQSSTGTFYDDHLADELLPTGKLGELVFTPKAKTYHWLINPETFNEIFQMAKGYTLIDGKSGAGKELATQWLSEFKKVVGQGSITTLPYGNPSGYWVKRLSPHNYNYFLNTPDKTLADFLGFQPNSIGDFNYSNYYPINKDVLYAYQTLDSAINKVALYLNENQLQKYIFAKVSILRPDLNKGQIENISKDQLNLAQELLNQVSLGRGKFTITSANQNIPITVINNFSRPVPVDLYLYPTNNRIHTPFKITLTLLANSKTPVLIPVHAISSGNSGVEVVLTDKNNQNLGTPQVYEINAAVISPIVTWITTLAAVTLFAAVIFRNLKKVINNRKVSQNE